MKAYDRLLKRDFQPSNDCRGCDYQGYEFGANYLDSVCINGYLWDADSGEPGGMLTVGGEEPCPYCNHDEWAAGAEEEAEDLGYIDPVGNCDLRFDRFEHLTERLRAAFQRGIEKNEVEYAASNEAMR